VVLHSSDSIFTAGAFWLFDYFGHKKLSILNGGSEKWMKEGRATNGETAKINPASYKANADASAYANADYVLKNLKNPKTAIVDTRGTAEYTGKDLMGNKIGGHLPGALDLGFYPSNLNNDGTFKSVKDLKAVYEKAGVTKDKEVITYCQAGVRAGHSYFVLKHILGYPKVRNYVGSWGEWGNRLDTAKYPVEK
jgi:thiosulfate/3-mercaptopyruvate sulfurtransferase